MNDPGFLRGLTKLSTLAAGEPSAPPESASYQNRLEAHLEWEGWNRQRLIGELMDEIRQVRLLETQRDTLLAFAQLVSDFCSDDSLGHMQYLKGQAAIAIGKATESES